jgi:methyl-accepting chemotaxis protein
MKIKTKLILTNLIIIGLSLIAAGLVNYSNYKVATTQLENAMEARSKVNSLNLADMTAFNVVTEDAAGIKSLAKKMASSVAEITFIEVFNENLKQLSAIGKGSGYDQVEDFKKRVNKGFKYYQRDKNLVTVAPIYLEDEIKGYVAYAESRKTIDQTRTRFIWITTVTFFLAFAFAAGITLFMGNRIAKPLITLTSVVDKAGNGDLRHNVEIQSQDEVGDLARSFQKMVINLRQIVDRIRVTSGQVATAADEISASSTQIAKGAERQAQAADETSSSMEEMSFSIGSVSKAAEGLASNVDNTTTAIQQMGATSENVASNAETMASNVRETSATIEEMMVTLNKTAKNATEANDLSDKASNEAKSTGDAVMTLVNGMQNINDMMSRIAEVNKSLGKRSEDIGEILEVIGEIADQTSLLALNATIEAARAGEAGRGFAVVADEVRKLAERSVASTKKIAKVIKQVQAETAAAVNATEEGSSVSQEGIELADGAVLAIKKITEAVQQNTSIVREISMTTEEQSLGAKTVISAVEEMNRLTFKVSESTKEQAIGIREVVVVSDAMSQTTSEVKNATSEQKKSGENVLQSVENINEIARTNLSAMEQLSSLASDMAKQSELLQELVSAFQVD